MNYSKQNINSLLQKDNWNLQQIIKASKVLDFNLLSFLSNIKEVANLPREAQDLTHKSINSELLKKSEVKLNQTIVELQKEIRQLLKIIAQLSNKLNK